MKLKNEGKTIALFVLVFFGLYYLPIHFEAFQAAVLSALELARWYAREHVVLCLLPTFFIAGAMAVFLSQDAIIKYLGAEAKKVVSYGVASVSGSVLAVCSCTILPLFAGIYKMGAGLGPATAFLYSGPAINVLAIVLTARVLGLQLGLARAIGAVLLGIVVGLSMHFIFRGEENETTDTPAMDSDELERSLPETVIYFALMVGILVLATLAEPAQPGFWAAVHAYRWPLAAGLGLGLAGLLVKLFNFSGWKLFLLAAGIGLLSYFFPDVPEVPFGLGLVGFSLVCISEGGEAEQWFEESWSFARQILPLLLAGVLVAGFFFGLPGREDGIVPATWVQTLVGGNSWPANVFSALAGAFMYFATLTEVPILEGLLDAGMGEGPALSLLLAGPAVSLPNLLVIHSVIGTRKTVAYFCLVVIISSFAGYFYGLII